jgi:drug/metabolite transporter (DMT)-like permease
MALINWLMGRDQLTVRGWGGIGLVFGGIALMIQSHDGFQWGAQTLQGDVLILLGTWCWSLYAFLAAPLMRRYSALRVTSVSTAAGALPLVVLGVPALAAQDWARVSAGGWSGLLYSAIFAIVIAFIIWNVGVQRIGGVRAAVYQNLTPIVATVVAAVVLREAVTPVKLLGTLLILSGLVLVRTA